MASIATCFTLPQNPCHRLIFKRSPFPHRLLTFPLIQTPNFPGVASTVRESRVLLPVVRASIAAATTTATAIRPGGAVESDKLPRDVRKRAMEAVDACGRRVTIGDVAGRAGLKLKEAQNALQALASDTEGFLEVSNEGDVIYVFPKDYRAKLLGKSFVMRVEPLLEKAKAVAEYLARVSFGTALFASIILVFTAIFVALLALTSEKRYWDPKYHRRLQGQAKTDDGKFGESFFSFVFGDGDPNQGIEEMRWKLIGQYIASNGGVVAAEELAPYLDIETSGETLTDEAYILPVLLRFEGQPLIDKEVYAGSFFVIPLFRWFFLLKTNADIEKEIKPDSNLLETLNRLISHLEESCQRIEGAPGLLALLGHMAALKLLSARYMAQKTVIGQDRIVYSTRTDLVEQELDRRFQEIEKSAREKDTITCD